MGLHSHFEMPLILQIREELPPAANFSVRCLLLARVRDLEHHLLRVGVPLAGHHAGQFVSQERARNKSVKKTLDQDVMITGTWCQKVVLRSVLYNERIDTSRSHFFGSDHLGIRAEAPTNAPGLRKT